MIRIVLYYDRRSFFFFYKNTEIIVMNTKYRNIKKMKLVYEALLLAEFSHLINE